MSDQPATLGSYPIERELGRGGMGVVYLGRDPRLQRPVAIKILSGAFAQHPEHLARFEREAKLLASLNHPNIAAIHGVEETPDGQRLLVLEYVPGDTLADRLARGAMPIDEALDYARQIALAIEVAHDGGIIHRDLKPGNVKITPAGQVKVLDFGLAKGAAESGSNLDLALSPTFTSAPTATGVILGTAGYMSPEQARGRPVDKRTDIWAFGAVLFECLTGRRLFDGETISDTIARILEREPDWTALPANTPPRVRDLLRRCLEKDLKKRQRDIGDVRIELEEAIDARSSSSRIASPATDARPVRWRWPRLAAALALLIAGAAAGVTSWIALSGGVPGRGIVGSGPVRLSVTVPADLQMSRMKIAPDGTRVILRGQPSLGSANADRTTRLYSRPIDSYDITPIAGTERVESFGFTPDGRSVVMLTRVADGSPEKRLMRVPLDGSAPPVVIAHWEPSWATFAVLDNGDLLVAKVGDQGPSVVRIAGGSGVAGPPIELDAGSAMLLRSFGRRLPDGGLFAQIDRFAARGYQTDVWVIEPNTYATTKVVENAAEPVYLESGHLLFSREDAIMIAPFDLSRRRITGEITALLAGLRAPAGPAEFGLAADGTLAYVSGGPDDFDRQLIVAGRSGSATPFIPARGRLATPGPVLSRDGSRAAVTILNRTATYETWIADATRGTLRRTFAIPNADVSSAVWSPDGRFLAYFREGQDDEDGVYVQAIDGGTPPRRIAGARGEYMIPTMWQPDGSGLIVTQFDAGKRDLLFVPMSETGAAPAPRPLRATRHNEDDATMSPDGRVLAFWSDESGRREVYVAPFDKGQLGAAVPVSNGACGHARWVPGTRRLYFCVLPGTLMSVDVTTNPTLSTSTPTTVLSLEELRIDRDAWDVLADGRIVGIQRADAEDAIRSINIVLNWGDEVRRRLTVR